MHPPYISMCVRSETEEGDPSGLFTPSRMTYAAREWSHVCDRLQPRRKRWVSIHTPTVCASRRSLGARSQRRERKGKTSWLGRSAPTSPNISPRSPQEPHTHSPSACISGIHGAIPSRVVVLSFSPHFLLDNPTGQRLLLTKSPITAIYFDALAAGGSPHCVVANEPILSR